MRDLNELNMNEGGKPVQNPPPSAEQISRVEDLLGATLPPPYVSFLMFSNGGHPELDTVAVNGIPCWNIDRFFSLSSDAGSPESVLWNYSSFQQTGMDRNILPIATNGGGDLFCLDLSETGKGKVILWIHDIPENRIVQVAESFEHLIELLITDPDDI